MAGRRRAAPQTEIDTGNVSSHRHGPEEHGPARGQQHDLHARGVELRADTGEEQRHREQHDGEHVVRRALEVALHHFGGGGRRGIQARRFGPGRRLVLLHLERRERRVGIGERIRCQPRVERGPEVRTEPRFEEVLEDFVPGRVGLDPLDVRGDIDLRLGFGQALRASGVDAQGVRTASRLDLFTVPPVGLIAAPSRGDRGERQQERGEDLDEIVVLRNAPALVRHLNCPASAGRTRRTAAARRTRRCRALGPSGAVPAPSRPDATIRPRAGTACRGTAAGAAARR